MGQLWTRHHQEDQISSFLFLRCSEGGRDKRENSHKRIRSCWKCRIKTKHWNTVSWELSSKFNYNVHIYSIRFKLRMTFCLFFSWPLMTKRGLPPQKKMMHHFGSTENTYSECESETTNQKKLIQKENYAWGRNVFQGCRSINPNVMYILKIK